MLRFRPALHLLAGASLLALLTGCGQKTESSAPAASATAGSSAATAAAAAPASDAVRVGFITDMSGVYADADGQGGVEAVKMAIADFGGTVLGKKIELLSVDNQNKADIAVSKAREWIDQQGVRGLIGGTNSSVALATAKLAAEKKVPYLQIGAATARLTNEDCTPFTVHYAYDTVAMARVTGKALLDQGLKKWYFLTADYAFGHSLEKDATDIVQANGGTVLGSVRAPLGASDFSSFLLQAQQSGAQVLGLANAGTDFTNSAKAANEFGLTKKMKLAALLAFINDVHALGQKDAQGLLLTVPWYWNQNDETLKFAKRFEEKMKRPPSFLQAADYSATLTWLNAVKAAGTTDGDKVMEQIKKMTINDVFAKNGKVRADGRMILPMYLVQVKTPAESKNDWDLYKTVKEVPGDQAFTPLSESKCPLIKKS